MKCIFSVSPLVKEVYDGQSTAYSRHLPTSKILNANVIFSGIISISFLNSYIHDNIFL